MCVETCTCRIKCLELRTETLSQPFCPQNFHLIDYNMLVFTVIILARRLIAAIVKEVRSGFNQFCIFSYEELLRKHVWFSFFLISLFPLLGITEWEAVVSSFHLPGDGPVCCVNADRLEPLPLPHLSLPDLLCPQPPLPLLPVNMEKKHIV